MYIVLKVQDSKATNHQRLSDVKNAYIIYKVIHRFVYLDFSVQQHSLMLKIDVTSL